MGLESFSYITSLNASNPVHATDQVSVGDDHVRGVKTTLLNSFPNVNAAVNPTPTEFNYVVGVTSGLQAQIDGKAATAHTHPTSDIVSGTMANARIAASNVTQHEAALTIIESQITGAAFTNWNTAYGWGDHSGQGYLLASDNAAISGAWSFSGVITLSDEFVTDGRSNVSTTGTINALATANVAVIRMTGVSSTTLNGMAGGVDGKRVIIINQTSGTLFLNSESGSASAANRLRFAGSVSISLNDAFEFVYDGADSRWQMIGF